MNTERSTATYGVRFLLTGPNILWAFNAFLQIMVFSLHLFLSRPFKIMRPFTLTIMVIKYMQPFRSVLIEIDGPTKVNRPETLKDNEGCSFLLVKRKLSAGFRRVLP